MGKIFKVLLIIILVLVGAIGGTAAILYFQINDDRTFQTTHEQDYYDIQIPINRIVAKSLKDVEETGTVNLELDSHDLDHILETIVYTIDQQIPQITTNGTNVEYIDEEYVLEISVTTPICPTVITIELEFEEWGKTLQIHIDDVKIGRLSLDNDLVDQILKNIDTNALHSSLEQQGVYCTIDLIEKTISISQDQLYDMLSSKLSTNPSFAVIQTLFELIKKNELYSINTTRYLNLDLDLHSMYVDNNANYDTNNLLTMASELTGTLYKQELIKASEINDVFDFLVNGYETSNKELINSLIEKDATTLAPFFTTSHKGFLIKESSSMEEIVSRTNVNVVNSNSINLIIDELTINNVINNSDFIGKAFAFGYIDNITDEADVSYIVIERLDVELFRNKIQFTLVVNLNGYSIGASATFNTNSSNNLSVEGTLDSIRFGNLELTDKQSQKLLEYFEDIASENWFTINGSNGTINFEFTDLVTQNEQIVSFLNSSTNKSVTVETKEDNFVLTFKIS